VPMFQFNAEDLSLSKASQAARAELPEFWSGWCVAPWFASINARLYGLRPVDILASYPAAVSQAAAHMPRADMPRTQGFAGPCHGIQGLLRHLGC